MHEIPDGYIEKLNAGRGIPFISNLMMTEDVDTSIQHPVARKKYKAERLVAGSPSDHISPLNNGSNVIPKPPGVAC